MARFLLLPIVLLVFAGVPPSTTAMAQGRPGAAARRAQTPYPMLDRLNRMTPEQRERVLRRLAPERRRLLEERLERYNRMSPEERQKLKEQYDTFQQLTPDNQQAVRRMLQRFSRFPEDRRALMRSELDELRQMDAAGRRARINAQEFRNKFSPPERRLLENLSDLLPAPE